MIVAKCEVIPDWEFCTFPSSIEMVPKEDDNYNASLGKELEYSMSQRFRYQRTTRSF